MMPDSELLERYARLGSQDAFAELVNRHLNLVYSAALRQVNGDAHLAQDVAQTVFADLARKAAPLSRRATITGWLYTSAHFAAAKIARTENRRRDREEKFMREPIHETAPETDWKQIRPTLDKAMHELKEADREAILLRYFENRQFAEVGEKLGLNENAARMRVERALEKLRTILAQGGISTTAALSTVISTNAIQLAPAGMAATLTSASLAVAGTGTTFTLLKIMTMTKFKLAISTLVVAGAAATVVIQHQAQTKLTNENQLLRQQMGQLQNDNEQLSNQVAQASSPPARTDDQLLELLRLRGEVRLLRAQTNGIGIVQNENRRLQSQLENIRTTARTTAVQISPEDQFQLHQIHTINAMKQVGLAMRLYASDNNDRYPTNFDQIKNELGGITNFTGNISLDSFEFVNLGLVNETMPDKILFRERYPRQTPDGGEWTRIYGLVDGSVQTRYSQTENFDEWEKPRMILPPTNQ